MYKYDNELIVPMLIDTIKAELDALSNRHKAEVLRRFFKTGKGDYGEGDVFIGVVVPQIRKIAKKYWQKLDFDDLEILLHSEIHEERALALYIMTEKFEKSTAEKKEVFDFYLRSENIKHVNNWDLVDLSCYKILGKYILAHPDEASVIYGLAQLDNLWLKRIAIVSTFAFIKENQFEHTIKICDILLDNANTHHLINKAIGWMLREVGKRDKQTLLNFLEKSYIKMSKISIRYATEKLTLNEKKRFILSR